MIKKVLKKTQFRLVLAGLVLLGSSPCLAAEVELDGHGRLISATPYDHQLKQTGILIAYGPGQNTRSADDLFNQARAFRYEADPAGQDYWQTPDETEARWAGDCEDKAVWLYAQLKDNGYRGVRLVVGRQNSVLQGFHVWVTLEDTGGTGFYVLDPTMMKRIWHSTDFPEGYYRPLYSFDGLNRYRHDR